jgi:glutamate dehydrogenase/leucine dehydrogenase
MSGPQHVIRPEDIEIDTQIIEWFSGQTRVAEQKFLKYIDFREA